MKAILKTYEALKELYDTIAAKDKSFDTYVKSDCKAYDRDNFDSISEYILENSFILFDKETDEKDATKEDWDEFDRLVAPFEGKGFSKDYIQLIECQMIFKMFNPTRLNPFDRLIKIYQESRLEEMQELIKQEQIYNSNNEFEGLAILNKYHKPVISHIDSEEIHSYHYTYALHIIDEDLIKLGQLGWCIDEEKHYFYTII